MVNIYNIIKKYDVKTKLRNGLVNALVFGGMAMFTLPIPVYAYLDSIRPEEPSVKYEHTYLSIRLSNQQSTKLFSLEEALDTEYIKKYLKKHIKETDSLTIRKTEIEASEEFKTIAEYEEIMEKYEKYFLLALLCSSSGLFVTFYGVKLNSKFEQQK